MAGLVVTATMALTQILNQLMRQLSDVEVQMNRCAPQLPRVLAAQLQAAGCLQPRRAKLQARCSPHSLWAWEQ